MTFLEAAIEILRREGKPLPIRRLAELAVQHNLLSVVGRDPEGTMQARLVEVLDKGPTHAELLRVRPDMFGLRAYPPRPYPVPREGAEAEALADADAGTAGNNEDGPDELAGEGAGASPRRRRRRRGGAARGPEQAAQSGSAERALSPLKVTEPAHSPVEDVLLENTGPTSDEAGMSDGSIDADAEEFDVDAGASSSPLMVAAAGDEELTRSGEEREVRSEILGRREERGRHRHGQRERKPDQARRPDHRADGKGDSNRKPDQKQESRADHDRGSRQSQPPRSPAPQHPAPIIGSIAGPVADVAPPRLAGERRTLGTDLHELLRAQEGRPQHVRALAQEVDRRKILEGRPQPEVAREVRMSLYRELSSRSALGLRPRVRSLGGGNYTVADRKIDEDVLVAERAVEAALERLHATTTQAVRRRLTRCSPFSFEQLARCCADAIGVERPTLVRRGEGVAYYGGERQLGAQRSRILIGIRPGEVELGRRAIGELRAGLDARGFDEGVLFSLGRLSADARDELAAGRAVTVYDGDSIGAFLIEHGLGVRTASAPIAYFDADFFAELNET